mmetsp:Transcript_64273/g.179533  ORF Transcript_64273/g.179533 Transcript_64273/m.179533 type:complete len:430 (-) Transcript_64273:275-1564(-)
MLTTKLSSKCMPRGWERSMLKSAASALSSAPEAAAGAFGGSLAGWAAAGWATGAAFSAEVAKTILARMMPAAFSSLIIAASSFVEVTDSPATDCARQPLRTPNSAACMPAFTSWATASSLKVMPRGLERSTRSSAAAAGIAGSAGGGGACSSSESSTRICAAASASALLTARAAAPTPDARACSKTRRTGRITSRNSSRTSSICISLTSCASMAVSTAPGRRPLALAAALASRTKKRPNSSLRSTEMPIGRLSNETTRGGGESERTALERPCFFSRSILLKSDLPFFRGTPPRDLARQPREMPFSAAWEPGCTDLTTRLCASNSRPSWKARSSTTMTPFSSWSTAALNADWASSTSRLVFSHSSAFLRSTSGTVLLSLWMALVAALLFSSRMKAMAPHSAALIFMLWTSPSWKISRSSSSVTQPGSPFT